MLRHTFAALLVLLAFNGAAFPIQPESGPRERLAKPHLIELIPAVGAPGDPVKVRLKEGPPFYRDKTRVSMLTSQGIGRNIPTTLVTAQEVGLKIPIDTACGNYYLVVATLTTSANTVNVSRGRTKFTVDRDCKNVPDVRSTDPVRSTPGALVRVTGSNFRPGMQVELSRMMPKPQRKRTLRPTGLDASGTQLSFTVNKTVDICGYVWVTVKDTTLWPPGRGVLMYLGCHAAHLSILTFNVRMMVDIALLATEGPRGLLFRDQMAQNIPSHPVMDDHDVIVFQEVFSDSHRAEIIRALRSRYPYVSRILGSGEDPEEGDPRIDLGVVKVESWEQDGGVLIMSRWPIENVFGDQRLFGDACHGDVRDLPRGKDPDCLAQKGVLYVRIVKEGQPYHIFATHMDAGSESADDAARVAQFRIIKEFIDNLLVPRIEPVFIVGDMNLERNNVQRYEEMLRLLGAEHPRDNRGRYAGATLPSGDYIAPNQCSPRGAFGPGPEEQGGYIDYILFSGGHLRPTTALNEVMKSCDKTGRHLSDHFPVRGTFWLTASPLELIEPAPPADRSRM